MPEVVFAPKSRFMHATNTVTAEYVHRDAAHAESDRWILPVVGAAVRMLSAGATVADLGCGNGALLGEFRARGLRLYGVDASSSGIGQAKRAYPEIHFSQGDLTG